MTEAALALSKGDCSCTEFLCLVVAIVPGNEEAVVEAVAEKEEEEVGEEDEDDEVEDVSVDEVEDCEEGAELEEEEDEVPEGKKGEEEEEEEMDVDDNRGRSCSWDVGAGVVDVAMDNVSFGFKTLLLYNSAAVVNLTAVIVPVAVFVAVVAAADGIVPFVGKSGNFVVGK